MLTRLRSALAGARLRCGVRACHPGGLTWAIRVRLPPRRGVEIVVNARSYILAGESMPHRKRLKRFNDPGHVHALNWFCFHGRKFLSKDRSRRWVVRAIERARREHPFDVWAYVLMPEHMHLLVCPTQPEYDIAAFCQSLKTSVVRRAVPWVRKHAPAFLPQMLDEQPNGTFSYRFWQRGGGYDRNLTHAGTVRAEIDYIHLNPVRRGLSECPEDWHWSSAADHACRIEQRERADSPLKIDFASLAEVPAERT